MALSKAEMEAHYRHYHATVSEAQECIKQADYCRALELAAKACASLEGMMQFERKVHNQDHTSLSAIDLIVHVAPALFASECVDAVENLVKTRRAIERYTETSLSEQIQSARAAMRNAYCLWNVIESGESPSATEAGELLESLGNGTTIVVWERMGLVDRCAVDGRMWFSLRTDLDRKAKAKCSQCGASVLAPKRALLEEQTCPRCKAKSAFVIKDSREVA